MLVKEISQLLLCQCCAVVGRPNNESYSVTTVQPIQTGVCHFQIEGDYHSISLLDYSGRVLFREPAEIRHDFSNLRPGLYLLTIHRKEGDQTLKIIKK